MRIIHSIAHLAKATGGTARCVPALSDQLSALGHQVHLVTQVQPGVPQFLPSDHRVDLQPVWAPGALRRLAAFYDCLVQVGRRYPDVALAHDHGVWLPNNHATALFAAELGLPRVVSVHGMLDRWSLNQSRAKKRLAWLGYQGGDFRSATLLHATADQELEDIRRLGLANPVALIPNGIDFPPAPQLLAPRPEGPRRALFLSRLHPKKGLLDLVRAWARLKPVGWELLLAGPDEGGYRQVVEQEIAQQGVAGSIRCTGPVDDRDKWALYTSAQLFLLPTYSENFGLVVAEALACGVPVITTRGAPWQGLETHGCGWWTGIGEEALAPTLRQALATDAAELGAMGARGRKWVLEEFGWPGVAEAFSRTYLWLAGQGPLPPEVTRD